MSTNSTGDHWITRSLDRKLRSKYRLFVERRIELESHGIWLFTGGLTRGGRSGIFQRLASCQLDCTVDFWREMENWKTPGPRRTMPSIQPIDFQSSLLISRIREGKKKRREESNAFVKRLLPSLETNWILLESKRMRKNGKRVAESVC